MELQKVQAEANALREYAGSDAANQLLDWINAANSKYRQDLVDVRPDGLIALQAQIKQLEALKKIFTAQHASNGLI